MFSSPFHSERFSSLNNKIYVLYLNSSHLNSSHSSIWFFLFLSAQLKSNPPIFFAQITERNYLVSLLVPPPPLLPPTRAPTHSTLRDTLSILHPERSFQITSLVVGLPPLVYLKNLSLYSMLALSDQPLYIVISYSDTSNPPIHSNLFHKSIFTFSPSSPCSD